jgi:hypothetical protein
MIIRAINDRPSFCLTLLCCGINAQWWLKMIDNGTDKLDTYMLPAGRDEIIKEVLPEHIVRLIFSCSFPTHS